MRRSITDVMFFLDRPAGPNRIPAQHLNDHSASGPSSGVIAKPLKYREFPTCKCLTIQGNPNPAFANFFVQIRSSSSNDLYRLWQPSDCVKSAPQVVGLAVVSTSNFGFLGGYDAQLAQLGALAE